MSINVCGNTSNELVIQPGLAKCFGLRATNRKLWDNWGDLEITTSISDQVQEEDEELWR